jgi:hypothetical protein
MCGIRALGTARVMFSTLVPGWRYPLLRPLADYLWLLIREYP